MTTVLPFNPSPWLSFSFGFFFSLLVRFCSRLLASFTHYTTRSSQRSTAIGEREKKNSNKSPIRWPSFSSIISFPPIKLKKTVLQEQTPKRPSSSNHPTTAPIQPRHQSLAVYVIVNRVRCWSAVESHALPAKTVPRTFSLDPPRMSNSNLLN